MKESKLTFKESELTFEESKSTFKESATTFKKSEPAFQFDERKRPALVSTRAAIACNFKGSMLTHESSTRTL